MKIIKQWFAREQQIADRPGPRVAASPLLLALEPRVVYDASVAAVAAQPHAQDPAHTDSHSATETHTDTSVRASGNATASAPPDQSASAATNAAGDARASGASAPDKSQTGAAQNDAPSAVHATQITQTQVVFIDPSVANYQVLIAGLPAGTQYVVLDANTDGLAQIAQYLQAHQRVESISLISHGSDGMIQVGSTWLTNSDFSGYGTQLAQIGAAMKAGGDFLIYGCDVAQQADGQALVQKIAALTHLNVAASTDATGSAALGGNWTLEYQVGNVRTALNESTSAQAQFNELLGVTTETYDSPAANNWQAIGQSQFTLNGLVYTLDRPTNTFAYNASNWPYPSDISVSPTDGVLEINANGASPIRNVTISLSNGHVFSLQSFDLSSFNGDLYIQANYANGSKSALIPLATAGIGNFTGPVSNQNQLGSAFNNIVSFSLIDLNDSGPFQPTLNNLAYIDNSPSVTTSGGIAAWASSDNGVGGTAVAVDPGITISDPGSASAVTATVRITNVQSGDQLSFVAQNGITGSYDGTTGILLLTGSGSPSIANWQAALQSVTFFSTQTSPTLSTTTRTVSFSFNDGTAASNVATRSITITATDQTPVLGAGGNTTAFVTGDNVASTPVPVNNAITVSDLDGGPLQQAVVTLTSHYEPTDVLAFTNTNAALYGNILASYTGGVLTLTSSGNVATLAQWRNALQAVTYSSTAITPGTGARTVSFVVSDGTKLSAAVTSTVTVADTDQTPIIRGSSGSATFTQGDNVPATPIVIDSGITLSDRDNSTLTQANIAIASGYDSIGDTLLFANDGSTMGNIAGTYSNGVLVLTSTGGSATLAQWQSALSSIRFTDSAATPGTTQRVINFVVTDGVKVSASFQRAIDVVLTDQTPIVTNSGGSTTFTSADNAPSTPIVVDASVTLTDSDSPTLASATVAITGNYRSGEDVLALGSGSFGDIQAHFDAGTGTLALTSAGSASRAQWQAALRSITYTDTAAVPQTANRVITFIANDGTKSSASSSKVIVVNATHQTPVLGASGSSLNYLPGQTATSIDSGITLTDLNVSGSTLVSMSITARISSGMQSGDTLGFGLPLSTLTNGMTMTFDGVSGTLTITSTGGTLAQWQTVLDNLQFSAPVNAALGTRTISIVISDGVKTSTALDHSVNVISSAPALASASTGSVSFVASDNSAALPVAIDPNLTVADPLGNVVDSAVVAITGNLHTGEDVLSFVNDGLTMGNITGSYSPSTGVLTLTSSGGSATLGQWQAALRTVAYTDTRVTPNSATRTVSFSLNAGSQFSNVLTRSIAVSPTDQTPLLTSGSTGSAAFVAGDNTVSTPVAIDTNIVVSDLDNATLSSATVQLGAGFHQGEDVLGFINNAATMGNITASYDAAHGTLTLTSSGASATLAQWQAALHAVTYTDTAITPALVSRTVSFTVSDGTKTSAPITRTVSVANTDQTPIVHSTNSGAAVFTSAETGPSTPIAVDTGIVLSDLDNTTLASATVQIGTGFHAGEDTLSFLNDGLTMGNVTGSYNPATGTLTLTSVGSSATLQQWQNALRAVTYTDSASSPDRATRVIGFAVNDGVKTSAVHSRSVGITVPDQAPLISSRSTGTASFVAGDNVASTPVAIDTGIALSDADNGTLASAVVQIGTGFHAGEDVLGFRNDGSMGNIMGAYNASTGMLTLSSAGATATVAQWQAALRAVTYTDTAVTPNTATRSIGFSVNDGTKSSLSFSRDVSVTATHQTPLLSADNAALRYTADGKPTSSVSVGTGITLVDRNDTPPTSATVAISGGFDPAHDVLTFAPGAATGDIASNYDAVRGVLTLRSASGTATLAQWQAAIQAVAYRDTQISNKDGTRTLTFVLSDAAANSAPLTRTLQINAGQDPVGSPILPKPQPGPVGVPNVVAPPAVSDHRNPLILSDLNGQNDAVSNPTIVLNALDTMRGIGIVSPRATFTFAAHGAIDASLGNTHVSALDPIVMPHDAQTTPPPRTLPAVDVSPVRQTGNGFALPIAPLLQVPSSAPGAAAHDNQVVITLADGAPLPPWLHFDAARDVLTGTPPAGVHSVQVTLLVRDAAGNLTRREVTLHFDAKKADRATNGANPQGRNVAPAPEHAALPAAKASLATQFANARAALHVATPAEGSLGPARSRA
ncbi:fibronectin type III domain-containing protein [Pandoraea communis]|uniref:Fibronectin type III domain-containing protein n=1 Tax=Pandoraea communis TaxID=2508297 RepID=A0A5E4Y6T9_9BURK|nr:DUF4347 domain-containing protein [Pandoraea communis]VVE44072.1 fibronectin type III domain-containing protein [Pandoraea communis]